MSLASELSKFFPQLSMSGPPTSVPTLPGLMPSSGTNAGNAGSATAAAAAAAAASGVIGGGSSSSSSSLLLPPPNTTSTSANNVLSSAMNNVKKIKETMVSDVTIKQESSSIIATTAEDDSNNTDRNDQTKDDEERFFKMETFSKYQSTRLARSGYQLGAFSDYICYSMKGGVVRAIYTSTVSKCAMKGHTEPVFDIAVQPEDGVHQFAALATLGLDDVVIVWELRYDEPSKQLMYRENMRLCPFANGTFHRVFWFSAIASLGIPSQLIIVHGSSFTCIRVDRTVAEKARLYKVEHKLEALAAVPIDVLSPSCRQVHKDVITDIVLCENQLEFLVCAMDGSIIRWSRATLEPVKQMNLRGIRVAEPILTVMDFPDDVMLTSSKNHTELRLWKGSVCSHVLRLSSLDRSRALHNRILVSREKHLVVLSDMNSCSVVCVNIDLESLKFNYLSEFQAHFPCISLAPAYLSNDQLHPDMYELLSIQTDAIERAYVNHRALFESKEGSKYRINVLEQPSTTIPVEDVPDPATKSFVPDPSVPIQNASMIIPSEGLLISNPSEMIRGLSTPSPSPAVTGTYAKPKPSNTSSSSSSSSSNNNNNNNNNNESPTTKAIRNANRSSTTATSTPPLQLLTPPAVITTEALLSPKNLSSSSSSSASFSDDTSAIDRLISAKLDKAVARIEESMAKKAKEDLERQKELVRILSVELPDTMDSSVQEALESHMNNPTMISGLATSVKDAISNDIRNTIRQVVNEVVRETVKTEISKAMNDLVSKLERPIGTAFESSFRTTLVPAFEAGCQSMVSQVNDALMSGVSEVIVAFKEHAGVDNSNNQASSSKLDELPPKAEPVVSIRPQQPTPEQIIQNLLASAKYQEAFDYLLRAQDLKLVYSVTSRLDADALFSIEPCPLTQNVLLSLIHQLSHDLGKNPENSLSWLLKSVTVFDPTDPMIREHVPSVLPQIQQKVKEQSPILGQNTHPCYASYVSLTHLLNATLRRVEKD